MRSIYFQNAKHQPNNITSQVTELNNLVIKDCIPKIISQLDGYLKYRKDISTLATPINRPISTYTKESLEFFKGPFGENKSKLKYHILYQSLLTSLKAHL